MTKPASKPAEPPVTSRARRRALATPAWVRRLRYWFSAENLKEFASTLALVIPLTVLIWIWAEREQIKDDEIQFTVDVRGTNPAKVVSLAGADEAARPRPVPVTVRISGPKVGVDAIRDAIAVDRSKAQVTLDVPDDVDEGETRDVAIQPLLDQHGLFRDGGITVKSTEPETVKVRSDAVAEIELKPTLPADLAARVDAIVAQPATVKVRGARQAIERLRAEGKLRAELDVSAFPALRDTKAGETTDPIDNVPIRPLDVPGVSLATKTLNGVRLTFSQAAEDTLASVIVNVSQPSALKARVKFTPEALTNVRISGPPDLLRKVALLKGQDRPYAEVRIERADQEAGVPVNRSPTFRNLPEGVRVIDPNATQIHVEIEKAPEDVR